MLKTHAVLLALSLTLADAGKPAPNSWTALNDGTFALPAQGWPNLTGPALCWIADRDMAVVAPILTEGELKAGPGYRKIGFDAPAWTHVPGKPPTGVVPDTTDSPRTYVYLPGLKKVLSVKQEWGYSAKKQAVAGWLIDPADGSWEPLLDPVSMSDKSAEFNPSAGCDGGRLPIWGAVCYDATNKEAVSFGGGGVWGRVGREREAVKTGDWIFDEAAKRTRRLTPEDAGKVATARRWYPSHCGTWLFSEAEKKWRAIPQPMGAQPSARILPGMAYDAAEKKIVLFGGDDLTRCFGDTWVYDCTTREWRAVKTASAPQPRAGHALVYVPDQKVVLLAGGYAGNWKPLKDVWSFSTTKGEWTRLAMDLPAPAGHASGDYDPKRGLVLLAASPETRNNKKLPVLTLKLDLASAPKAPPEAAVDPRLDYHSTGKGWGSLLPEEWLAGKFAPGDAKAGLQSLAALPANTWVVRKPPAVPPGRDWGSCIYDLRTHRGYAWGGGHSTYPGADVIEYDLGTDRWRGMSDAANYNPAWLHGMVSGPPGVSAGGWSLLPTHSRKSYGIDVASNALITYVGDVYDLKHRMYLANIGRCPGQYGVATQVSFCSTPHGLYGYSSNTLAKANVAAGRWDEVARGGPKHDEHGHLCHDSKRDRLIYFVRDTPQVWSFDFKTRLWAQEQVQGASPAKAHGDSTYLPELDAALLVFANDNKGPEQMYFYKLDERRWYRAACDGEKFGNINHQGRDFSPVYDPELKTVVRLKSLNRMEVAVLRLVPSTLKLTPLE